MSKRPRTNHPPCGRCCAGGQRRHGPAPCPPDDHPGGRRALHPGLRTLGQILRRFRRRLHRGRADPARQCARSGRSPGRPRPRSGRRLYHHPPRAALRPGQEVPGGRAGRAAGEAHGHERATRPPDLIDVRDRTGRLLVVAFNGSLSPQIRKAVRMLRSGSWANPQHPRGGLAELEDQHTRHLAADAHSPAAAFSLTRARTCSTPWPTWPGRILWRWRPGWTTGAPPWTSRRGHGPAGLGHAGHPERLRQHHPVVRIGHPGLLHGGHPAHGGLGPGAGCAAGRRGELASHPRGRGPGRVGSVHGRAQREHPQPLSAGSGPAHGPAVGRHAGLRRGRRAACEGWLIG